jgi:KUP system potassium uptake protein
VPHIPWERRLQVDHIGNPRDRIIHIVAEFGFQDRSDIPAALRRAGSEIVESDLESASYFLSRITLRLTHQPGMSNWRKRLFVTMAHNSASHAEYLCLPDERTVVMGSQVDI